MKNLEYRRVHVAFLSLILILMVLIDPKSFYMIILKPLIQYAPAILIPISGIYYLTLILRKKVTAEITSWITWVLISIAVLFSIFRTENDSLLISAIAGSISPPLIVIFSVIKKQYVSWKDKKTWEKTLNITCAILSIVSIVMSIVIGESSKELSLSLAILADGLAIIPVVMFVMKHPDKDRPFMWILFGIGYMIPLIIATKYSFETLLLPISMFIIPAFVWVPLVNHRIKNKIPLREWI